MEIEVENLEGRLWKMRVAEKMTTNPTTVGARDSLAAARALMQAERFKHLPVVEGGRLVGVISDRDLRVHTGNFETTRVDAAMTSNPVTIVPQAMVEEAARLMLAKNIGCLVVTAHEAPVGIVTTTDMLKALLDLTTQRPRGDDATHRSGQHSLWKN
jgi:acetoin utilization protein AcuB